MDDSMASLRQYPDRSTVMGDGYHGDMSEIGDGYTFSLVVVLSLLRLIGDRGSFLLQR